MTEKFDHYGKISRLLDKAIALKVDHKIIRVHLRAALHKPGEINTLDRMTLEAMGRVIFPIPEDQYDPNSKK